MVAHTGYLKYFDLRLYDDGFVLMFPNENTKKVAEFKPSVKHFDTLNSAREWSQTMGVGTIGALNDAIAQGRMQEMILVQEALMEKKIGELAQKIASSQNHKFVMIAGPSSSGKTTFSHRLSIQLATLGPVSYTHLDVYKRQDVHNKIIGFGGRVMGEGEPKYLNSPETKIFDKSRNLYGLNFARTTKKPQLLLCEGYMDVIALHQAGFDNAVASLGTALTSGHANLLKRYTREVYLTYDSDGAGVKAALRAIPILKEVGIVTKVINMRCV